LVAVLSVVIGADARTLCLSVVVRATVVGACPLRQSVRFVSPAHPPVSAVALRWGRHRRGGGAQIRPPRRPPPIRRQYAVYGSFPGLARGAVHSRSVYLSIRL
jgi:hypothetical protein